MMKTSHLLGSNVGLAAACVYGLMALGVGSANAGGPMGVAASGSNGAVAGGRTAVGTPVVAAHVSAPTLTGGRLAATRVGANGGTPHYLPGGFTPNVFPSGPLANASRLQSAVRASRPSMDVAAVGTQPSGSVNRNVRLNAPSGPRNAWTDPASADVSNTTNNRRRDGNFSGTILYPDASRDVLGNRYGANNAFTDGANGSASRFRFRRRGYYNPYGYGNPYVFYGGDPAYVSNDLAGVGTNGGDYDGAAVNGAVGPSNALSADAADNVSRPYPPGASTYITTPSDSSDAPTQAPVPQTAAHPNLRSNSGPDSLVEAVQAELARRGYFGGKIDAVYNDATHAALQRFQADQQLAATGRINEATLHALQLD